MVATLRSLHTQRHSVTSHVTILCQEHVHGSHSRLAHYWADRHEAASTGWVASCNRRSLNMAWNVLADCTSVRPHLHCLWTTLGSTSKPWHSPGTGSVAMRQHQDRELMGCYQRNRRLLLQERRVQSLSTYPELEWDRTNYCIYCCMM